VDSGLTEFWQVDPGLVPGVFDPLPEGELTARSVRHALAIQNAVAKNSCGFDKPS
jgi:hypothetical protein